MRLGGNTMVRGFAFAALLVLADVQAATQCTQPVWQDEFDTELDTARWSFVEGDGCEQGLCGWGNNEQQRYDRETVSVADGKLAIRVETADTGSAKYRSGKIVTSGHFAQRFGRFEARIKLPVGRGLWPAFWLLPESPEQPWPLEGEIDILEWVGNDPHRIIGAAHFGDVWPGNVHYSETLLTPFSWSDEYHTFAVEWRAGEVAWFVDGRRHGTMQPEHVAPHPWLFDKKPFYIVLNVAVGGTLGGDVVSEDLPAEMLVDWVRVFDLDCDESR